MKWEYLRSDEMEEAISKSKGLCIIPIGCTEKHGEHLPLGTDSLQVMVHVDMATKIEEAVVFPCAAWLGDMLDNHHFNYKERNHGCITLSSHTLLTVLEELCDEIAKNGFTKILFVNCHGGNVQMLNFFLRAQCYKKKNYATMTANSYDKVICNAQLAYQYFIENRSDYPMLTDSDMQTLKIYSEYPDGFGGGHGDFVETAWIMGAYPELVATDRYDLTDGRSIQRTKKYKEVDVSISSGWQADHPNALSGRAAHGCTETIGQAFNLYCARRIAKMIKAIKDDDDCVSIATGGNFLI